MLGAAIFPKAKFGPHALANIKVHLSQKLGQSHNIQGYIVIVCIPHTGTQHAN